jgi:probable HAF family extracellular repeat protein
VRSVYSSRKALVVVATAVLSLAVAVRVVPASWRGGGDEASNASEEAEAARPSPPILLKNGWVLTDLGTLGGLEGGEEVAINGRGQIVGISDANDHAFLWEKGKMRDLGTLGGPGSWAVEINDKSQVVGVAYIKAKDGDGEPIRHAFLWANGKMRDLGTLGGTLRGLESEAVAVNDKGQVVGWADTKSEEWHQNMHAFLWANGKMRDLGTLGGTQSWAEETNQRGQVVGWAETKALDKDGHSIRHAFLWQKGKMSDLGTLGGLSSGALAINERGQVVGEADTNAINKANDYDGYGQPISRAFLWQDGEIRDLGTFGGPDSGAVAINRRGQIVGWADTRNTSAGDRHIGASCGDGKYSHPAPHAFLWANGRIRNLSTLGGLESEAVAISDTGQVVGWADTRARDSDGCSVGHASIWENGKITDLGTLPGGSSSEALAINNRGQVIGWSKTKDGYLHAVLWTLKP